MDRRGFFLAMAGVAAGFLVCAFLTQPSENPFKVIRKMLQERRRDPNWSFPVQYQAWGGQPLYQIQPSRNGERILP